MLTRRKRVVPTHTRAGHAAGQHIIRPKSKRVQLDVPPVAPADSAATTMQQEVAIQEVLQAPDPSDEAAAEALVLLADEDQEIPDVPSQAIQEVEAPPPPIVHYHGRRAVSPPREPVYAPRDQPAAPLPQWIERFSEQAPDIYRRRSLRGKPRARSAPPRPLADPMDTSSPDIIFREPTFRGRQVTGTLPVSTKHFLDEKHHAFMLCLRRRFAHYKTVVYIEGMIRDLGNTVPPTVLHPAVERTDLNENQIRKARTTITQALAKQRSRQSAMQI